MFFFLVLANNKIIRLWKKPSYLLGYLLHKDVGDDVYDLSFMQECSTFREQA